MTAKESRKNRILELIIDKVFGAITEANEKELNELINHPDEDRKEWERLFEPDSLMDFMSSNFKEGNDSDLEAAKAMFDKLIDKKR